MPTFALLTRLIQEEIHPSSKTLKERETIVTEEIAEKCPDVRWVGNYATYGSWSYLDIFEASDLASAMRVSLIVRRQGGAVTEVWPLVEWQEFKAIASDLHRPVAQVQHA